MGLAHLHNQQRSISSKWFSRRWKKGFGEIVKLVLCTLLAGKGSEKRKKSRKTEYHLSMARTWASASCGDLRLKQQPHREKSYNFAYCFNLEDPSFVHRCGASCWRKSIWFGLKLNEKKTSVRACKLARFSLILARRIIAERFVQLFESKEKWKSKHDRRTKKKPRKSYVKITVCDRWLWSIFPLSLFSIFLMFYLLMQVDWFGLELVNLENEWNLWSNGLTKLVVLR